MPDEAPQLPDDYDKMPWHGCQILIVSCLLMCPRYWLIIQPAGELMA